MRVQFFGDIALHGVHADCFELSEPLRRLIGEGDLNVGNFECPVTESEARIAPHPVHLKCRAGDLKLLAGFHAFSLANNHLLDYGAEGLNDTIRNLEERHFQHFGSGQNRADASRPLLIAKDGIQMAFIGATRFSFAKSNAPGPAKDSMRSIGKAIERLKREKFFVVIYFHWGYEYVPFPSPRERRMAQQCIDHGADLVVGSHPHIMQGIESYKGKAIFYSLGNFIFDPDVFTGLSYHENDPRLFRSFIVSVDVNASHEYVYRIHPYRLARRRVELLTGVEEEDVVREVENISAVLRGHYFTYLKQYFRHASEISRQNKKVRIHYTFKDGWNWRSVAKIYSRVNYQDVLNKLVGSVWKGGGRLTGSSPAGENDHGDHRKVF